jgi:hypothetical protein
MQREVNWEKIKRLLRTPIPYPDEGFFHYTLRLSEENGYETPYIIFQLAGLKSYLLYTSTLSCRDIIGKLSKFAILANLSVSALKNMLYQSDSNEADPKYFYLNTAQVPKHMVNLKRPKICTSCIRELGYVKRIWDLTPVTACPRHKELLLDKCPNCGNRIIWNRSAVSVCRCGCDWRDSKAIGISEDEARLSQRIYELCQENRMSVSRPSTGSNPLYELDFEALIYIVFFIAGQQKGISDTKGRMLATSFNNAELHFSLTKAFEVFDEWPQNFNKFLGFLRTQKRETIRQTGLQKDFGTFYYYIYRKFPEQSFNFVRSAFETYLTEEWDGGYIVHGRLKKINSECNTYMTKENATRVLNTADVEIQKLVDNGTLKAVIRNKGKNRLFLIKREDVQALKQERSAFLNLAETAKKLGIRTKVVPDLVENGCFEVLGRPETDQSKCWKVEKRAIEIFIDRIESKIEKTHKSGYKNALSLKKAANSLGRLSLGIGHLLKAVLDGDIQPCGTMPKKGIGGLQFFKKDIKALVKKLCDNQKQGLFSIVEVANLMGVNMDDLGLMIKKGIIPTEIVKNGRRSFTRITQKSIDEFNRIYIRSGVLARSLNYSWRDLPGLLESKGILPVLGRKEERRGSYLYRKTEVESIDLKALVSEMKSNRMKSSKREKLFSDPDILQVGETAKVLGVKEKEIQKFAKSGELKSHPKSVGQGKGSCLGFTRVEIDKFRELFLNNTELVSDSDAAKMLNERISWLYKKWVALGLLNPAIVEGLKSKHFFKRSDVLEAMIIKKETVTCSGAAKILGIRREAVLRKAKSRKLTPVFSPQGCKGGLYLFLRSDIKKLQMWMRRGHNESGKLSPR